MRLNKAVTYSLIQNRMKPDPNGIWCQLPDLIEKSDYDTATVSKVVNPDPDGNESKEFIRIECSEFCIDLTLAEVAAGRLRHGKSLEEKSAAKPAPVKKKRTRKSKADKDA